MKRKCAQLAVGAACCVVAIAGLVPEAEAFYPRGFFDQTGQLIYPRWPLDYMDVNGDGDVSGPNEGVLLNFESGPLGWEEGEITELKAGFETWENVPTAFIAFHYGQDIPDPVELEVGFTNIDFFNIVAIQLPEDAVQVNFDAYVFELTTFTFEATTIQIGDTQVTVGAGEMLDVDMVFDGPRTRQRETDFGFGIRGLTVLGTGSAFVGLEYSPFTNFDEAASQAAGVNVEKRVVWLRDASGQLREVGVTSSLVNDWMYYEEGGGILSDSMEDLAPDDIAGVSFLYPRTDTDAFFDLAQQARTRTREGFPSKPIAGGHIMAWCDTDNNPASARVPFIDTLTGLYEQDSNLRGHFIVRKLFKQLEDGNGITYPATYVLTCAEFAPHFFPQEQHNSTHQDGGGFGFDSLFPSEVFRESGNIFGIQNLDQGTPLEFDLVRRKIVSADSGKTLDLILAAGTPMFGDANQVCPLNVVVAGLKTTRGPDLLRRFRDTGLMNTAVGVAAMDAYYRVSPALAQFLLRHGRVLGASRWVARGVEWALGSRVAVAGLLITAILACAAWRMMRQRRVRLLAGLLMALGGLLLLSAPVGATCPYKDMEEHVAASDDIITGRVSALDSHWTNNGLGIVTEVTIDVSDVVKGRLNKSGKLHFTMPVGRVGAIGRWSAQLPEFNEDEEVLLLLKDRGHGYLLTGDSAGKYGVRTDPDTGKKFVRAESNTTKARLIRAAAKINEKKKEATKDAESTSEQKQTPQPKAVALDDFKDYLRDIDKEQRKAK